MPVTDVAVIILAALGALLLLVSAVGTVRLEGVLQRMQAASVGTALGITLLLLSAGIHFIASAEMVLMLLLIVFFFVTSPIATTAMARAAYRRLPHSTHTYLMHDDMADANWTPDYKAREADGQASSQAPENFAAIGAARPPVATATDGTIQNPATN